MIEVPDKIKDAILEGRLHRRCYNLSAERLDYPTIMESNRDPEGNEFTESCNSCLKILKEG